MANAVWGWSPVIMMTRIPAARHLATASFPSGRGGSYIQVKPTNTSSRSTVSADTGPWKSGPRSRRADPQNPKSLPAREAFSASRACRSFSVKGRTPSAVYKCVQSGRIWSGAPFVNARRTPLGRRRMTVLLFRSESKGISSTFGNSRSTRSWLHPALSPSARSAPSVGSPITRQTPFSCSKWALAEATFLGQLGHGIRHGRYASPVQKNFAPGP